MNNDLLTKALDNAKGLQKTLAESIGKSLENAHPLVNEAVAKANDLKGTLTASAAGATEAVKPHVEDALGQLTHFIELGKGALESGVTKAQEQMTPLAAQVKTALESAAAVMAKKPADATRTADESRD